MAPQGYEYPREYEDAFAVGDHGVAAIADGVSEAIFSRQWAQIVTSAVTQALPDPDEPSSFSDWLRLTRCQWQAQIAERQLSWMQRQKLHAVRGAYATLLWVAFPDERRQHDTLRVSRFHLSVVQSVIGCLFHVRDNQLLRSFPLHNNRGI